MLVRSRAAGGLMVVLASFAVSGGAIAQSSGAGSSGAGAAAGGGSPSYSQSPAAGDMAGGGSSGLGGRLPPGEGGLPGGPESEKRIPETKSHYTRCPDGSRGDLNAGGCLGGAR